MTRPTTEELKSSLEQLVKTYNNTIQIQQTRKEQIIGIQAVLNDRMLEDEITNDNTSESTKD